jgi:hypothetical protein
MMHRTALVPIPFFVPQAAELTGPIATSGSCRMTGNSSRVSAARPADIGPLTSVMILAFAADPVARWMYRDQQRYLAHFGRFIQVFAGKAFSTGTAWCPERSYVQ